MSSFAFISIVVYALIAMLVAGACLAELRSRSGGLAPSLGALAAGALWPLAIAWTVATARIALRRASRLPVGATHG